MVRTYVRIYGPPVMKAIKALEGVAIDVNKEGEIKFSNKCIPYPRYGSSRMGEVGPQTDPSRAWQSYIHNLRDTYVDCYEPARLISEAHEMLGDSDFFFEWKEKPTLKQIEGLIEKIDGALSSLGCYFTLKTA